MSYRLEVLRFYENEYQTLSKFIVLDDYNCELAQGYILELPDRNNQRSIYRIPEGDYTCVKRYSEKYRDHFHVLDVENRDFILIHYGNYYTNTRGCLLVGSGLVDIDGDGLRDVTHSKKTMNMLNKLLPRTFELSIYNQF